MKQKKATSQKNKETFIAPVALDMGAKHTGVYRAIYEQGTQITEIKERYGEVLNLDNKNYTLLMEERTAKRHARRNNDRGKMAKRLLLVALERYFGFPARKHAQALNSFLNRRGFTRLEAQYNEEALEAFPEAAWRKLPESAQKILESRDGIGNRLRSFIDNEPKKIAELRRILVDETIQPVKDDGETLKYVNKLLSWAEDHLQGKSVTETDKEKNKLSQTPAWIVERLKAAGVQTFEAIDGMQGQVDLATMVRKLDSSGLRQIQQELQPIQSNLKQRTATVWKNVRPKKYDAEKNAVKLLSDKEEDVVKAHLHNLVYAIAQAHEALSTGSRHRRRYFEEIEADIGNAARHPHRDMQAFASAIETSDELDKDNLYRLIAHISNLELKPLRAYFNDKAHKGGDQWQPDKLARIVSRWFMKQWRVNAEKDDQATVKRYRQLKEKWKAHRAKNDIIAFWLNTDPELTIPPYQSQTNRRPPDCQSLILNLDYMNRQYPGWGNWLDELDASEAPDLSNLRSRKGKPLLDEKEQKLRQLQFMLDRAQGRDPYRLNLIWSQYHSYQKGGDKRKQAQEKLEKHLAASMLPGALKNELTQDAFSTPGSFGHFLNKYYQSRRKARDGRYFLHPQNHGHLKPGKLDDQNKLLTLCPHRPRQKRHQMHMDFAAIVGMPPEKLEKILDGNDLDAFLLEIRGLKKKTGEAAKAQKDYRGALRERLINGNDRKLKNLSRRVEELALELARRLWPELDEAAQREKSERFNSLFSFAQIHNIVFKERSGFSNTCPVCSTDNAGRMVEDDQGRALAARLPALSIRLIDGAVRRLCEYKAVEIVRRHWAVIEPKLKAGHEVRVPLILEQNRFEFELSLSRLKGKKPKNTGAAPQAEPFGEKRERIRQVIVSVAHQRINSEPFGEKRERIRQASAGICPYSGNSLNQGQFDHIIPRKSRYGTLNDEANLIYASTAENLSRSNQAYYLSDLAASYKERQFDTADDDAIRQRIYQILTGGDPDTGAAPRFVFGQYLNFINLNADQQRAFRHALFLADDDPLKQLVIRALQNRNRTFVNGTQRYFAQVIADKLHQRAKRAGLAGKLSFDYFEYPADPRHPKGTQLLRNALGLPPKEEVQEDYSHHIDAHMAFLLACDDHRGDGSMGVDFDSIKSIWPFDDGDITAYRCTEVQREMVNVIPLGRRASSTGNRPWRAYHRDNFYADRYMPLWLIFSADRVKVKKGFSPENSVTHHLRRKQNQKTALQCIARFSSDGWMRTQAEQAKDWLDFCDRVRVRFGGAPAYIPWARNVIAKHCVEVYPAQSLAKGKNYGDDIKLLRKLAYQTQKKAINSPEDIESALKTDTRGKGETRKNGIDLPARSDWLRLQEAWEQAGCPRDKDFDNFLRKYFLRETVQGADEAQQPSHKKTRRVFSLPIYNENAHYLQARRDITGDTVYQLIADSDSRKDGNKFKRAAMTPAGDMVKVVNTPFQSKRMFKLKQDKVYAGDDYINIDPDRWYEITRQMADQWKLDFPEKVRSIAYRIDNVSRPKIRLKLEEDAATNSLLQTLVNHQLTRPKEKKALEEALEGGGVYIGSGFNNEVKRALSALFQHEND